MPSGIGKFRGGSGIAFGVAQANPRRLPGSTQVTADTRFDQFPGTRFFDVIGTEAKTAYVTADIGNGTVAQYKAAASAFVKTPKTGELSVANIRGDYQLSNTNDGMSWEVGKKKQIIYLRGLKYDISAAIGENKTIRAAYRKSDISATVLTVNEEGVFSVYDVKVVDNTATAYTIGITPTVNTGRDETDVKQLYSAFVSGTQLVSIEIRAQSSVINLFQQQKNGNWLFSQEIGRIETVTADSTLHVHRTSATIGTAPPSSGQLSYTISSSTISSGNTVQDVTTLTGKRIVAARAGHNQIAILVETVDTTCDHNVSRPAYAAGYFMWQYFHPLFAMGFRVGQAYDWRISTGAYDSGKLMDKWTRHSAPTYTRHLFKLTTTTVNGSPQTEVKETIGVPFSGGSLDSETSFYYRYANVSYQSSNVNQPVPMDTTAMITTLRAREYSENAYRYVRTWNNCIRFYAADPLSDTYLYFKMNGTLNTHILSYTQSPVFTPDEDYLQPSAGANATLSLVVRRSGLEHEYMSRPLDMQVGVSIPNRSDMHFEPHMIYYTQPQPKSAGPLTGYFSTENIKINKSINLCFSGRYTATDSAKTGFAVDLSAPFDVPDFDYPIISSDARYIYFTEGSIVFPAGTVLLPRTFFESWRSGVPKNGDPEQPFDSDAPLDLEFRNFEDRHRRANNFNVASDDVELLGRDIPPEWPDIRGWGDFRRRGGFTNWDDAQLNPFVTQTLSGQPPSTTYNFITSESTYPPPITVMEDF